MRKLVTTFIALLMTFTMMSATTYATNYQAPIIPQPSNLPGPTPLQIQDAEANQDGPGQRNILIQTVLPNIAVIMIGIVAGASLLFLTISGLRFVTLYGNEEGVEKAKNQAIYAIAGLALAFLSYTIVSAVSNIKIEGDGGDKAATPTEQSVNQAPNNQP